MSVPVLQALKSCSTDVVQTPEKSEKKKKKKEKKRKDAVASVDPEHADGEDTMEVDAVGKLSYLRSSSQDSPARS